MVVSLHNKIFCLLSFFSFIPQRIRYELVLKCRSLLAAVDNQISDKNHVTSHIYPLNLSSDPGLLEIGNSAPSKGPVRCSQSVPSVATLSLQVDHDSWWQISINAQLSLADMPFECKRKEENGLKNVTISFSESTAETYLCYTGVNCHCLGFSKLTKTILSCCITDKAFQCSVLLTEVFSFLGSQPQINSL